MIELFGSICVISCLATWALVLHATQDHIEATRCRVSFNMAKVSLVAYTIAGVIQAYLMYLDQLASRYNHDDGQAGLLMGLAICIIPILISDYRYKGKRFKTYKSILDYKTQEAILELADRLLADKLLADKLLAVKSLADREIQIYSDWESTRLILEQQERFDWEVECCEYISSDINETTQNLIRGLLDLDLLDVTYINEKISLDIGIRKIAPLVQAQIQREANKRIPLPKLTIDNRDLDARYSSELYTTSTWRRLRLDVLAEAKKAGRCRCVLCGNTADDSQLHIDHIKPRSKYPELALERSNLQILCRDCNISKGNRYEADWRSTG